MGKAILIVVIIAAIVVAIVLFKKNKTINSGYGSGATASQSQEYTPTPTASASVSATPTPSGTHKKQTINAIYTSTGLNPKTISIAVGDTVKFINEDTNPHWPASDPHPLHNICPGFDALKALQKGDSYSFIFKEAKMCPFHDHLDASSSIFRGQINVGQ